VMAAQTDLVEVVHTLKQVICVKGLGEGRRKKKASQVRVGEVNQTSTK
jgi:hypothetical protein